MKIVHFATDEKFTPLVQSLFEEAFAGCNTYLVPRPRSGTLEHITDLRHVQLRPSIDFKLARWLLPPLRQADVLVVHGMTSPFAKALRAARAGCTVVWVGWGFDYYRLLEHRLGGLLLGQSARLMAALGRPSDPATPRPRKRQPIEKAAARIDVFSVNPSEVALLREVLPTLRGHFHVLPSFTVEDVFERGPAAMAGPDVMLGNAASATNNHLEAFECLQPLLRNDQRLVVPLSYGKADYADHIARVGRERFGERFVPLRQWLPIEAYNDRLQHCGIVVMNHRRQKAVGNIGTALYKGAKVFLRPENPLFGFYTDLGAVIHSVEALEAGDAQALQPLGAAERLRNREVVIRRWSRAAVLAGVRQLASLRR